MGGPVGSAEHQKHTLRNEGLQNAKMLFEALPRLPTAQGGLVLLRSCGVPKFSYFLRVTPPNEPFPDLKPPPTTDRVRVFDVL